MAEEYIKSLQFPQLHTKNLDQLRSAVFHFVGKTDNAGVEIKGIYLHGDGNMYTHKSMSDDRKIFHNDHPANEGASYRAYFTKSDAIPRDLAELEKMLQKAKMLEDQQAAVEATKKTSNDLSFPMIEAPKVEPAVATPPPPPPPPPLPADDKQAKAPDKK